MLKLNKYGLTLLHQTLIEIIIISILLISLIFFVVNAKGVDRDKITLTQLNFLISIFDDAILEVKYKNTGSLVLDKSADELILKIKDKTIRENLLVKKEFEILENKIFLKNIPEK